LGGAVDRKLRKIKSFAHFGNWHLNCIRFMRQSPAAGKTPEPNMNLMNSAIDHFILHEISALRTEENRLNVALSGAPADRGSDAFLRAIAELEARIENLDSVLQELEQPVPSFGESRRHAA
jgi:hypothetical protein